MGIWLARIEKRVCQNWKELIIDKNRIDDIFLLFNLDNKQLGEFYYNVILNNDVELIKCLKLSEIKRKMSKFHLSYLAYYFYKTLDVNVLKFLQLDKIKIYTNGVDLMKLGYKQGPLFTEIFDFLLQEKFNNPAVLNNKDAERDFILMHFPKK